VFGMTIRFHFLAIILLLSCGCEMRQGLDEFGASPRAYASSTYLVYFGPAPVSSSGNYLAMA